MEKNISYINRDFESCKQSLINFSKKYYPDMAIDYNDASVASWMIDINAACVDDLSYHLDRVYQETNIDSANKKSSIFALARNNGMKIPGPKGAMAEVKFTCYLPISGENNREPNWSYAPIIKRGTKVAGGAQIFEVMETVDFGLQFDENGQSNRTITPILNSNGLIVQYQIAKTTTVVAGESKIYKKAIFSKDIVPFLEIVLPDSNVMNVESIVVRTGTNFQTVPSYGEFYSLDEENKQCKLQSTRYFEVDSLAQQFRWGEVSNEEGAAVKTEYAYVNGDVTYPVSVVTKGAWKRVQRKFMTEYTDAGYMKITFGAGIDSSQLPNTDNATEFSKFQIDRIIRNESLGILPTKDSTIFVLYRVGGGKASNLAQGAINTITYLNAEFRIGTDIQPEQRNAVKNSLAVISTTPSVSGKDMPSERELKYLIKYNSGEQNRCVTVKDYISRTLKMPAKYGTPFRVGAAEENNKIMLYLLGLDYQGHLDATLPVLMVENISNYLSQYRMINDYVEIKSGKIVNLKFDIDVFIDKNYNASDVIGAIITTVADYMDINNRLMGDDIFIGDVEKEISKVDGVLNLIDLRVWNKHNGTTHSGTRIGQEIITTTDDESLIDLEASDGVIYSEGDTMLEIKYPERDIIVHPKSR